MSLEFIPIAEVPVDVQRLVLSWRNSPDIRSKMLNQRIISWEEHLSWTKQQMIEFPNCIAKVAYEGQNPFGVISLNKIDREQKHSDWGMYIGNPAFRGKGLGTLLLEEIIRWGFQDLGLFKLYTSVLANNVRALSLYLKRGFQLEGNWRAHVLMPNGKRVDLLWLGLFSS